MPLPGRNRVIMDSVHGLTEFDQSFRRILDTRELQRLRWIRQTGLVFLVYPGAEHSRFSHALGAYGIAKRVLYHIRSVAALGTFSPSELDENLEKAFLIAALCHDLGHTPFSHVLEQLLLPQGMRSHEDCTLAILKDTTCQIGRVIRNVGCDLDQVIGLLDGVHWNDGLCKLLSGSADVDRWDYLLRDAAASGLIYGSYDLDWMIHSIYLLRDAERKPRLVIEAPKGFVALKHFLAARRSMYQQVYWYDTVRGAERLLRAIFERASDPQKPSRFKAAVDADIPSCLKGVISAQPLTMEEFLETDDTAVISFVKYWAFRGTDPLLKYLSRCLLERRLFKAVASADEHHIDIIRAAVKDALTRQRLSQLSELAGTDLDEAVDYLVLTDSCRFNPDVRMNGILFDLGQHEPVPFEQLDPQFQEEILSGLGAFQQSRIFVPSEVAESVQNVIDKGTQNE
jgi:HD superfamily phosphohydrolase